MGVACDILLPMGAATGGTTTDTLLALDEANQELRYDVRKYATVAIQAVFSVGASPAVLTVYRSLNSANVVAMASAVTITPAATMTAALDMTGIAFLHVRVTTADAGDTARITVIGKYDT